MPHTFPDRGILHLLWGGQSCPQPPFRRLFRAARESSEPQSPAESRLQPGLAAPRFLQNGHQNQKVCGIRQDCLPHKPCFFMKFRGPKAHPNRRQKAIACAI
jgi:hypothetical protein